MVQIKYKIREILKKIAYKILNLSLISTNKKRNELELKNELAKIVPDISKQYTTHKIDMKNNYLVNKVRGVHAFQISIVKKAMNLLKNNKKINIVDIGDSSGTHLIYLNNLYKNSEINTLSVNLDVKAVDKIKSKGLKALVCRAEELHLQDNGMKADLFLSFEMLEHLFDPISFLRSMSAKSQCEYFVITVPYVINSRVALQFIKYNTKGNFYAENTHIFELSPKDWNLIFKFSGWEIVYADKYRQYPSGNILNFTKYLWRTFDFDGFYGAILKKNEIYSK